MSALAIIMGVLVLLVLFGGVFYGVMKMERDK